MDSTGMYLTPNTVTPQSWFTLNLKDGPIVMEVPPNVLGPVDDAWFRYVADIGYAAPKGNYGRNMEVPGTAAGQVMALMS